MSKQDLKDENLELSEEIASLLRKLNKVDKKLDQYYSYRQVAKTGIVRGLATALGATIIFGFFYLYIWIFLIDFREISIS